MTQISIIYIKHKVQTDNKTSWIDIFLTLYCQQYLALIKHRRFCLPQVKFQVANSVHYAVGRQ